MSRTSVLGSAARAAAATAAIGAAGYAAYAAITWSRYGKPSPPRRSEEDDLLDRFMPDFDVVERHHLHVRAPAAVTLEAARTLELSSLPGVHAIFKARELLLRADAAGRDRPKGLVAETLSLGWVVLDEIPGREIVVGSVTKPWEANVVFRSVAPEAFAAFDEPGYVKIAWTLRADPSGPASSTFRTETRALATDAFARRKFRVYWSFLSPGIFLIRRLSLRPVKTAAEQRFTNTTSLAG